MGSTMMERLGIVDWGAADGATTKGLFKAEARNGRGRGGIKSSVQEERMNEGREWAVMRVDDEAGGGGRRRRKRSRRLRKQSTCL